MTSGTKQEAITATRALCGYRVRRFEEFADPDLAARSGVVVGAPLVE